MDSKQPDNENGVELDNGDQFIADDAEECGKTAPKIHTRMFEAHKIVGALEKDDTAKIKKDGKLVGSYDYHSHDAVVARAKEALVKVGVLAWPTMVDMQQNSNRTRVDVNVCFINVDDPSDTMDTTSFAYGCDNQDKGPGKAYSYAIKNALLKALMISTGEDVEASDTDFKDESNERVAEAQREAQKAKDDTHKIIQDWAEGFKTNIKSATSVDGLEELQKINKSRLSDKRVPSALRTILIEMIEERKTALA